MDQIPAIASAIGRYLDLMYDADDRHFSAVFHDACLIHGMQRGTFTVWSAAEFRDVIRGRPSPAAVNSPRDQAILTIEQSAPDLAVTKVRVRIGQTCFVDHLILHCIDGNWLVTTKAFHVARVFEPGS